MKQSTPIRKQCQHRSQCERDAVVGVYRFALGQSDVNLDKPVRVFCSRHKPSFDWRSNETLRIVKLARA